jgi:hypothetical protein
MNEVIERSNYNLLQFCNRRAERQRSAPEPTSRQLQKRKSLTGLHLADCNHGMKLAAHPPGARSASFSRLHVIRKDV